MSLIGSNLIGIHSDQPDVLVWLTVLNSVVCFGGSTSWAGCRIVIEFHNINSVILLPIFTGRRVFSRKVVLLVTDGQSNFKKHLTIPKADELKIIGVDIFVIGVGTYIRGIDEMVKVASSPVNRLFRVNTYRDLLQVVKLIIKQVSPDKYAINNGQYDPPC